MNGTWVRAGAVLLALGLGWPSAALHAEEGAPAAEKPAAPKLPGDIDGVLLDDGRQIVGSFEEWANQRWVITPADGSKPVNVCVTQIVVAEKGGVVDQKGEDAEAAAVWRAAVGAAHCDALERAFDACAAASLVARARAALAQMKECGAGAQRLAKLAAKLEGLTEAEVPASDPGTAAPAPAPDKAADPGESADPGAATEPAAPDLAAAARARAGAAEEAARAVRIDALGKGVDWCAKRGFVVAATSLVNEIARLDAAREADMAARAKELMPEGFYFKDAKDAVAQWRMWADVLLPASAQFVDKADEDAWRRLENKPWTDGATLAFRTRNVLLFIRDMNPEVCGRALRLAEQTVRALQIFLNDGEPDVVTSDVSRLEIRIHKTRADYLSEEPARGQKAEVWSAGYFSPSQAVSHFYVDRDKKGRPDLEELTRVLTHEFTHHYISARWMPQIIRAQGATATPGGPGFWVVEGMADFVQYQSHRLDAGPPKFDDDFVAGNEVTAEARKSGLTTRWLTLENFIDMRQNEFANLGDEPMGMVKLRRSKGVVGCSERSLWYAQASALTYFFLQKKGPEMRKRFVRYVSDHYAGNTRTPSWKTLGYASAAELEKDFDAFLRTVTQ